MKKMLLFLLIFSNLSIMAQDGKAVTVKNTFNRTTKISKNINASPETIWQILTEGSKWTSWNSTITSLDGKIAVGEKIALKVKLDPKRTFKIKVKEMQPNKLMVWGDAMGKRVYTLNKKGNQTVFTMDEKIGGLMYPLFANKIPSFDEAFETFAADLKTAAESQ